MMAGPTITVSVLADTRKAEEGFERVGDSADDMSTSVRRSSRELGESVDDLDGKANSAERGFRGFSDSLNGTSDVMGGLKSGNLVQLGMGLADLAGAVQDLVLPLLQQMAVKLGLVTVATEGQTAAQEASNVAMAANPIGLVVIALAALAVAFYVAWTKSETFREIVTGAFDAVAGAAEAAFGWIRDHWPLLVGILTGPFAPVIFALTIWRDDIARGFQAARDAIGRVWSVLESILTAPFHAAVVAVEAFERTAGRVIDAVRGAVDWLIGAVERLVGWIDRIHWPSPPGWLTGAVGGAAGVVTRLNPFADGGRVPGNLGQPVPILAHAGEVVLNAAQQRRWNGGGTTIYYLPTGYNNRALRDSDRRWTRINGGADRP
jgi:phage-related protein